MDKMLQEDIYILLQYLKAEKQVEFGGEAFYFQALHSSLFHLDANEIALKCIEWRANLKKKNAIKSFRIYLEYYCNNAVVDLFSSEKVERLRSAVYLLKDLLNIYSNNDSHTFYSHLNERLYLNNILSEQELGLLAEEKPHSEITYTHFSFSEEIIRPIIAKFVMSASALNTYLRCPIEFYFLNILKMPQPQNSAATYGSAIHFALEQLFRKMKDSDNNIFPDIHFLLEKFEQYITEHTAEFTSNTLTFYQEKGQNVLTEYYHKYIHQWNKIVLLESFFKSQNTDDIPMKGFIDKIEFDGNNTTIVDYKSGRFYKGLERLEQPNAQNILGGDYWRQAVFYKLLVQQSPKNWNVEKVEFDFLDSNPETGAMEKISFQITPKEEEIVSKQIDFAWNSIQNLDFHTGCKKMECIYCQLANRISS